MWIFLFSFLVIESVQSASIGYPYRSFFTYSPQKSTAVHGYYLDNYGGHGDLVTYNDPQSIYAVREIKYINSAAPMLETTATQNSEEFKKARESHLRAASLQQYQHLKNDIETLKAEGKKPSPENLSKLEVLEKIAFTSDFSLIAELPEVKSTLLDLQMSISGLYRGPAHQSSVQSTNIKQSTGEIKTYVGNTNISTVAIEETPDQEQARVDHLRIYKEQIAHLKQLELEHQKYILEADKKSNIPQSSKDHKDSDKNIDNSKAFAELEQATQEHFRLLNEAKLRAEQAAYKNDEQSALKTADQQQMSAITNDRSIFNLKHTIQDSENQQLNKRIEEHNVKNSTSIFQHKEQAKLAGEHVQITKQRQVADTPEVVRAHEEHLHIVNESILKSQQEQVQQQRINPKEAINYRTEQSTIEDTPEVKKAREEHLRFVQEANQRTQLVEQQELQYKQGSQVPISKLQFEIPQEEQTQQPLIAQVEKAHVEHLRQLQQLSSFPLQQQPSKTHTSGETAEVQRAREDHLGIFNSIKAHTEQEQGKKNSRIFPHPQSDQKPISDFAIEEERLLKLERLREAERLQKEHQLLELDRLREAERLAEEKRQMDAELTRLRLEEEQRFETERLSEQKRLQQEQEELKALQSGNYQEIIRQNDKQDQIVIIPNASGDQTRGQQTIEIGNQQHQQFANNPFLKTAQDLSEAENPKANSKLVFPKTAPRFGDNTIPNVRYIQSSHHSGGSKHQYGKDDKVKHSYYDSAGYQPADTAVALIALEKATKDHFRAHELALEQLRLTRLQNPSLKDCN